MDEYSIDRVDGNFHSKKSTKPLMEKRRRARINKCLSELKEILLDANKNSTPGPSKWEKADILEMTVAYVRSLINQRRTDNNDPMAVGQFLAGFSECIKETRKFLITGKEFDLVITSDRLTDFLLSYLKRLSNDTTEGLSPVNSATETMSPISSCGSNRLSPAYCSASILVSPNISYLPIKSALQPPSDCKVWRPW